MAPALKYVAARRRRSEQDFEPWAPDCDAGVSTFRVTDRRRRWTKVRHFMDVGTALRHATANDGVVWERYVGPTGAVNWWSLTDEECEARTAVEVGLGDGDRLRPEPGCVPMTATQAPSPTDAAV